MAAAIEPSMIREDYIIGWIKRYIRWLAEIAGFVKTADYEAAARRVDLALRDLLGIGPDSVLALTDGELLARLTVDEPPPVVRDKCLLLAALLNHLGSAASGQNNADVARDCWLKALQIVLATQLQGRGEDWPEFAPAVPDLMARLQPTELPSRTHAALLIYHEQRGEFAKAEDALFRLLDATEQAPAAVEIGFGFYQRMGVLSDDALAAGDFSRAEVAAGLAELQRRQEGAAP